MCEWCVDGVWLVCEWCVIGVWMACTWCVIGVWNRVSGLSSSHEQYKEKVHIDGWMKLLHTHADSWACVLPELLAGVLRRVFISFMSLMLWIYMDSSRHTTSLCKTADQEQQQHYVNHSCMVRNCITLWGKIVYHIQQWKLKYSAQMCRKALLIIQLIKYRLWAFWYSFSWKCVNYCNWMIACCILTADAWIQH